MAAGGPHIIPGEQEARMSLKGPGLCENTPIIIA